MAPVDLSVDLSDVPAQTQEWPGRQDELSPAPDHGESSWVGRGRLKGKRALITGGDSGIGRAIAIAFAKEGAMVACSHLDAESDDAADTARLVSGVGGTCMTVAADLRDVEANHELVDQVVAEFESIDVLVCNAAFQMSHGSLEEFPDEQIERTFATNVFSPFWLIRRAAAHMPKGGSILVTTSVQAYSPSDHLLDYAATKAALNNLVVNLAAELGPRGIRVNAVAPGPIWTPLIPATMPADRVEGFGADTPLGRAGHPIEVAAAYVFLASDEASYVSGTVLGVTGGKPVF